jgi:pyruvate-formate lyase-activating enzyme
VPLIPSVTDTRENLTATARLLEGAKALERVELMGYNRAAGAKYAQLNLPYEPEFPEDQASNYFVKPFAERGMEVVTL